MTAPGTGRSREAGSRAEGPAGVVLCLISAVCFAAMTIFGKLAFAAGLGVLTLLAIRFSAAALLLGAWFQIASTADQRLTVRAAAPPLALGCVVYAGQSAALFFALERVGASLAVLLLYAYPLFVALGAARWGVEGLGQSRIGALTLSSIGLVLVLGPGLAAGADAVGIALGVLAAAGYALYVLLSDRILERTDPILASALVCAGVAVSMLTMGLLSGGLTMPRGQAWLWLGLITLVSTALAIACLYEGIRRLGPTTASLLSTIEPVVAVMLALVVFAETLAPGQLLGGALVVAALVLVTAGGDGQRAISSSAS